MCWEINFHVLLLIIIIVTLFLMKEHGPCLKHTQRERETQLIKLYNIRSLWFSFSHHFSAGNLVLCPNHSLRYQSKHLETIGQVFLLKLKRCFHRLALEITFQSSLSLDLNKVLLSILFILFVNYSIM